MNPTTPAAGITMYGAYVLAHANTIGHMAFYTLKPNKTTKELFEDVLIFIRKLQS